MSEVLVLACGNPLREDDGFGERVAVELAGRVDAAHVELRVCAQLTPELAEPVSRAARVVFVDASELLPPGRLAVEAVAEAREGVMSHHVEPGLLLGLAGALYGRTPEAWLVSLGGQSFGLGVGLSPAVEARVPDAVVRVVGLASAPIVPARPPCPHP